MMPDTPPLKQTLSLNLSERSWQGSKRPRKLDLLGKQPPTPSESRSPPRSPRSLNLRRPHPMPSPPTKKPWMRQRIKWIESLPPPLEHPLPDPHVSIEVPL